MCIRDRVSSLNNWVIAAKCITWSSVAPWTPVSDSSLEDFLISAKCWSWRWITCSIRWFHSWLKLSGSINFTNLERQRFFSPSKSFSAVSNSFPAHSCCNFFIDAMPSLPLEARVASILGFEGFLLSTLPIYILALTKISFLLGHSPFKKSLFRLSIDSSSSA